MKIMETRFVDGVARVHVQMQGDAVQVASYIDVCEY